MSNPDTIPPVLEYPAPSILELSIDDLQMLVDTVQDVDTMFALGDALMVARIEIDQGEISEANRVISFVKERLRLLAIIE